MNLKNKCIEIVTFIYEVENKIIHRNIYLDLPHKEIMHLYAEFPKNTCLTFKHQCRFFRYLENNEVKKWQLLKDLQ